MMQRIPVRLKIPVLFVCLSFMITFMPCSVRADESDLDKDENSIELIKYGVGGVEIYLHSSKPFPVRALPPILHIGSDLFHRSYNPPDGDLNRLVFIISREVYARLGAGDPVILTYGQGVSPREMWEFGNFNKRPFGRRGSSRHVKD